jgi:hypothetical protein
MRRLFVLMVVLLLWPASHAASHGNPTECATIFESTGFIQTVRDSVNSIWLSPIRSKVQDFWCDTSPAGSSITIDPKINGISVLTAPLVCTNSGAQGTVDLSNNTILRGERVDLDWSDGTGQPYRLTVCFEHTIISVQ